VFIVNTKQTETIHYTQNRKLSDNLCNKYHDLSISIIHWVHKTSYIALTNILQIIPLHAVHDNIIRIIIPNTK